MVLFPNRHKGNVSGRTKRVQATLVSYSLQCYLTDPNNNYKEWVMFASDREKEEKQNLIFALAKFEMDFGQDRLQFDAIEELLLTPSIQTLLNKDTVLFERFATLYAKSIYAMTSQLVDLSRYRFVAMKPREFKYICKSNPEKSPNFSLLIDNSNSLGLYVQTDVLRHASVTKGVMAIQRWATIAVQACSQYDYETAHTIYCALGAQGVNRYRKYLLGERTIANFAYLAQLFADKDQWVYLRDQMIGQCIPFLGIYSSIITKAVQNSAAQPIRDNEVFRTHVEALQDMQTACAALIEPSWPKGDSTVFTTTDACRAELCSIYQAITWKDPARQKDPTFMLLDDIVYYISVEHTDDFKPDPTHTEANGLLDKLLKRIPFWRSKVLKEYHELLQELRLQIPLTIKDKRGYPVPNTSLDEREVVRRTRIRNFIKALTEQSSLHKKSTYLEIQIRVDASRKKDHPDLICDGTTLKYFERILSLLKQREEEEKEKIIQLRREREESKQDRARRDSVAVRFSVVNPLARYTLEHKTFVPPLALKKLEQPPAEKDSKLLDARPSPKQDKIEYGITVEVDTSRLKRQSSTSSLNSNASDRLSPPGAQTPPSGPTSPVVAGKTRLSPKNVTSSLLQRSSRGSNSGSALDSPPPFTRGISANSLFDARLQMPASPSEMRSRQYSPCDSPEPSALVSLQNSPHDIRQDSPARLIMAEVILPQESPPPTGPRVSTLSRVSGDRSPHSSPPVSSSPRRNTLGDLRQSCSGVRIPDSRLGFISGLGRSKHLRDALTSSDTLPETAEEKPSTPAPDTP